MKTKKQNLVSIVLVTSGKEYKSSGKSVMDAILKLKLKPMVDIGGKTYLSVNGKPVFIRPRLLQIGLLKPINQEILDKRFALLTQ